MGKHGLTKKELNRYKKAELLKICKDNNISCSTKSSKAELVSSIFKNKSLRKSLPLKPKRKMSEKQRANLEKFRFKNTISKEQDESATIRSPLPAPVSITKPNPKSKVEVNPTASNKNEPAPASLKQDPSETNKNKSIAKKTLVEPADKKAKILKPIEEKIQVVGQFGESKEGKVKTVLNKLDKRLRDKASFSANKLTSQLGGTQFDAKRQEKLDSHTQRLLNNIRLNKKKERIKGIEHIISTNRTTDYFDRQLAGQHQKLSKMRIDRARDKAMKVHKQTFDGQLNELGLLTPLSSTSTNEDKLIRLQLLKIQLDNGVITKEKYDEEVRKLLSLDRKVEEKKEEPVEEEKKEEEKKKVKLDNISDKIVDDILKSSLQELSEEKRNQISDKIVEDIMKSSIQDLSEEKRNEVSNKIVDDILKSTVEELSEEKREEISNKIVEDIMKSSVEELSDETNILNKFNINELKNILIVKNLDTTGKKSDLIKRIKDNLSETDINEALRIISKKREKERDNIVDSIVEDTLDEVIKERTTNRSEELNKLLSSRKKKDEVNKREIQKLKDKIGDTNNIKTQIIELKGKKFLLQNKIDKKGREDIIERRGISLGKSDIRDIESQIDKLDKQIKDKENDLSKLKKLTDREKDNLDKMKILQDKIKENNRQQSSLVNRLIQT